MVVRRGAGVILSAGVDGQGRVVVAAHNPFAGPGKVGELASALTLDEARRWYAELAQVIDAAAQFTPVEVPPRRSLLPPEPADAAARRSLCDACSKAYLFIDGDFRRAIAATFPKRRSEREWSQTENAWYRRTKEVAEALQAVTWTDAHSVSAMLPAARLARRWLKANLWRIKKHPALEDIAYNWQSTIQSLDRAIGQVEAETED